MVSAFSKLVSKDKEDKITAPKDSALFIDTSDLFYKDTNKTSFSLVDEVTQPKKIGGSSFSKLMEEKPFSSKNTLGENEEDENGFAKDSLNVLSDIIQQPVGGVVDAAESIFNLLLPKEKEIEISDWVDGPKTIVGKFVRPASQFFVPFGGAYNIAAKGFLFIKNANNLKKTTEAVTKAQKALKTQKINAKVKSKKIEDATLSWSQRSAIGGGIGFGADFVAFAPTDPNLADLMVQFPATKNAVTEWLQTDPNGDPGMERLKNALTGLIPGYMLPEFTRGVAKGFGWSTKPLKRKIVNLNDKTEIKERIALSKKFDEIEKTGKKDFVKGEIDILKASIKKRRTRQEKVSMFFRETMDIKKHTIEYLDNVKGIDYLMRAAKAGKVKIFGDKKGQLGAYGEARFIPAIGGMTEHFLLKQTFKFKDGVMETTGRDGLQLLLKNNLGKLNKNESYDDFFNYMGAKMLTSLDSNIFKGLYKDAKGAKIKWQKIADAGDLKPNYVKTLSAMDEFNKDLLQIAVDSGLITQTKMLELLAKRPHYLPLYRDLSNDELFLKRTGGNKLRVPLKAEVPIGMGPDELPLSNFFDNYVENVSSIISSSYKNHVKRTTFDIIDDAVLQGKPLHDWAIKDKNAKIKTVTVKADELKTQIKKQKDIDIDLDTLDDLDDLALFRSERIDVGDNEYVFRTVIGKDGVEKTVKDVYKINSEYLKLTMDSISPKVYYPTHSAVKIGRWVKNLLTRGVTLDPGFWAGANAVRDTVSAAIFSNNSFHLPVLSTAINVVKRISGKTGVAADSVGTIRLPDGKVIPMKELYMEFILNGGSFGSTLLKGEIADSVLKTLYRKMGHSDYQNVLNTPKKYLDNYENVVGGFENASRFTEYTLLRKAGVSAREAALGAREVAVDFGMHGANNFFRQYVSTVPFMNAGLQGLYRTVRAVSGKEKNIITGSTQRALVVSKLTSFVVVPTIVLYAMNRDNPDYWNQSQQIRDTNFMLSLGKGKGWIKIPKPFDFGAIATLTESTLSQFDGTAKADPFFATFWTILKDMTRISAVPQVVAPLINARLNQNFFGSPIIPENMKNNIPDYGQSYPWTSKSITKSIENAPAWLRNKLMSPLEFENYWRAYTGAIGGFALDLIDEGTDLFTDVKSADRRLDELPFLKRFLQLDPAKYTKAEAQFYELRKKSSMLVAQAKKFKNEFKFELLEELMSDRENQELFNIHGRLEMFGKQIAQLNKKRNQILNLPNMSGARKRMLLDELESASGKIFNGIMTELQSQQLEIFKPIFEPTILFN
tara:strand:- start:564 stop:4412 length:3849 start_codon:yes stop_codon:yes gene_type:complete